MKKSRKKRNVLSTVVSLCVVSACIVSLSFVVRRVEDYNEKKSVISDNVKYIESEEETEPEKIEKYEQIDIDEENQVMPDVITEAEPKKQMPADGDIIMAYIPDEIVYLEETGDYRAHKGIDITTEKNGAYAIKDGTVVDVYYDINDNFVVKIDHGDYISLYRNLNVGPDIIIGKNVEKGENIGKGATNEKRGGIYTFRGYKRWGKL